MRESDNLQFRDAVNEGEEACVERTAQNCRFYGFERPSISRNEKPKGRQLQLLGSHGSVTGQN
jgi:hypothetical protein